MAPSSPVLDDAVLGDLISRYIGVDGATISRSTPFADIGLDSIAAVQLADELLANFKFVIHSDELFGVSLEHLSEYIQESSPTVATAQVEPLSKSHSAISPLVNDGMAQRPGTRYARLLQVISDVSGIPLEYSRASQPLGELGIDSFLLVQLQQQLGESYNVHFMNLRLDPAWTVQDLIDFDSVAEVDPADAPANYGAIQEDAKKPSSVSNSPLQNESIPNPFVALAQSEAQFEKAARKSGFHGYWEDVAPLQNDLLLAYITEAFRSLGVDLSEYPHGTEIPPVQHIPKYDRLLKRLFNILETRYIVSQRAGKVLRASDKIDVNASSQLCHQLRTQHPEFECEANLMGLVGPKLGDCLKGTTDPVSVLFGNPSSLKIMEDFYANAPMMSASTDQLITFLVALLRAREQPARILEVGAGTGGTTARLAKALAAAGIAVEYTFTDIGAAFVNKAKTRFRDQYPWMSFEILDLELEATPATLHGRFDVALGANVVHATSNRVATCRRLREMLRPGGILVLSEVTRVVDWFDICFGLLDGWWRAEGGKGYPIQSARVWMEVFERAGYRSWGFSKGESEEARSQQLLVGSGGEYPY